MWSEMEKMAVSWCLTLALTVLASADGDAFFFAPSSVRFTSQSPYSLPHPLTILPERPFAAAPSLAPTPLYVVPGGLVRILDPHAPVDPEGVTPGVRVILRQPLVIDSPQASIAFPSGFTVDHQPGVRMPMSVGALVAPVPASSAYAIHYPITVRVVYAVASVEPAFYQPSYAPYAFPPYFYPHYSYQTALAVPQEQAKPAAAPTTPSTTAVTEVTPVQEPVTDADQDKPGAPPAGSPQLITVLDFPTAVASPDSLFFQPPQTGDELGNREPPQALIPAGIVQSAAPIPNLSVFINSKESQYLQALREEALKVKTPFRTPAFIVHGDTVQVDAL
ncbi:uncharacterized protein LOC124161545 isoform X2 [Ischnura elegans]|uniref:uncharacterized protein LOC124161545 isoform X2 n=1 Tax=Ischnura elegans TaxID=197161 RepID=UPI001ED87689|nr:uncharacterized protein LOC124161545 isoform X2 [Ischnura elegans]